MLETKQVRTRGRPSERLSMQVPEDLTAELDALAARTNLRPQQLAVMLIREGIGWKPVWLKALLREPEANGH